MEIQTPCLSRYYKTENGATVYRGAPSIHVKTLWRLHCCNRQNCKMCTYTFISTNTNCPAAQSVALSGTMPGLESVNNRRCLWMYVQNLLYLLFLFICGCSLRKYQSTRMFQQLRISGSGISQKMKTPHFRNISFPHKNAYYVRGLRHEQIWFPSDLTVPNYCWRFKTSCSLFSSWLYSVSFQTLLLLDN